MDDEKVIAKVAVALETWMEIVKKLPNHLTFHMAL
jgi:hypothetical protein